MTLWAACPSPSDQEAASFAAEAAPAQLSTCYGPRFAWAFKYRKCQICHAPAAPAAPQTTTGHLGHHGSRPGRKDPAPAVGGYRTAGRRRRKRGSAAPEAAAAQVLSRRRGWHSFSRHAPRRGTALARGVRDESGAGHAVSARGGRGAGSTRATAQRPIARPATPPEEARRRSRGACGCCRARARTHASACARSPRAAAAPSFQIVGVACVAEQASTRLLAKCARQGRAAAAPCYRGGLAREGGSAAATRGEAAPLERAAAAAAGDREGPRVGDGPPRRRHQHALPVARRRRVR